MSNEIKDDDDDEVHSAKIEEGEDQVPVITEEQPPSVDTDVNGKQTEVAIPAATADEQLEVEPSISLSNTDDTPVVPLVSDVSLEKEEDPLPAPASEDNDLPLSPSEESTSPSTPVQSEVPPPADDTHQLLKIVADKSNKEASSAILNTVCTASCVLCQSDVALRFVLVGQWRLRLG